MSIKSKGRMIRKGISKSKGIASLSMTSRCLFFMIIPHLNGYGKANGSPYFIKGEVVPLIDAYSVKEIEKCLKEISKKTNMKWFDSDGLLCIHSIKWEEHQDLRKDRLGADELPTYSGTTPGLIRHEVELELKEEVELELKEEGQGFVEDSIEFRLAEKLFHRILELDSDHKKPDLQKWAHHIDLLIRIDRKNPIEIGKIIDLAHDDLKPRDEFCWARNILSTKKLREKYSQLKIKLLSDGKIRSKHQNMIDNLKELYDEK